MDKILTIIIPTYNMSEYLDTCLKSLIINSNLLEVLVINDGSKDNSLDIAKKYEKEYPHIFRTIDKQMVIMVLVSIVDLKKLQANILKC